jgi:hypothetical protein
MDGWWDILALDALCELRRHARVHFHGCAVLCLVQYSHSQVSRTRPNFKDFIRRTEIGLYGQISSALEIAGKGKTFCTILDLFSAFYIRPDLENGTYS